MNYDDRFELVAKAWQEASRLLSFEIISPYVIPGTTLQVPAYLPYFGRRGGTIVTLMHLPNRETERAIIAAAKKNNFFCSAVNPDIYSKYDEELFKETLIDWSFYGDKEKQPYWLGEK